MWLLCNKPSKTQWHRRTTIVLCHPFCESEIPKGHSGGWLFCVPWSLGPRLKRLKGLEGRNHLKAPSFPYPVPGLGGLDDWDGWAEHLLVASPYVGASSQHGGLLHGDFELWLESSVNQEKAAPPFWLRLENHAVSLLLPRFKRKRPRPHQLGGGVSRSHHERGDIMAALFGKHTYNHFPPKWEFTPRGLFYCRSLGLIAAR